MTATSPSLAGPPRDIQPVLTYEPMAQGPATVLAEFARACKAAARAVSLYPGTHPAIGISLSRLVAATSRLVSGAHAALTVDPRLLVVEGCAPTRPDAAIVELADLLHVRSVGTLTIDRDIDQEDWRAFLLLAGRPPEDLIALGGIARAWSATGRPHLVIAEIDYAEVLREREGREGAAWDRVLAYCLRGESADFDEATLRSVLAAFRDSERFAALLQRLQAQALDQGAGVGAQVAALFQFLKTALGALAEHGDGLTSEQVLSTAAGGTPTLTPDMLLGILERRRSDDSQDAAIAHGIAEHIDDGLAARFVANAVTADQGATERLAQAFAALIPEVQNRERVVDQAREEAKAGTPESDPQFDALWTSAATMLVSYSDAGFVSADYARELSGARAQAVEIERSSDDPPERVEEWLASVTEQALAAIDIELTLDLLRLSSTPDDWEALGTAIVTDIERRTVAGELDTARRLAEGLAGAAGPDGRPEIVGIARKTIEDLANGPLMRHVVVRVRRATDTDVTQINGLCRAVGPGMVRPLAEALTIEDHTPTIRRLRELLLSFGPAGRQAVEPLKNSSNPAVRRTAIDLLRVFGGNEALKELTSMLNDADTEVQRESVRAVVQIGTPEAYAVLRGAVDRGDSARDMVVRQVIGLRDERSAPLLCHVLNSTTARGPLVATHVTVIEALAGMGSHAESLATLTGVLYRGEWWAPSRTTALRRAAAEALHRIGSPEALEVLETAVRSGRRGVRRIARQTVSRPSRGDAASTSRDQ